MDLVGTEGAEMKDKISLQWLGAVGSKTQPPSLAAS